MRLYIKKKKSNFIYFQIIFTMIVGFLHSQLHLPSILTYLTDVVLIYMLLTNIKIICSTSCMKEMTILKFFVGMFLVVAVISALLNISDNTPFRLVWATRNTGRTFFFLFSCVALLSIEDVHKIFRIFDYILFLNLFLCSWQFWVQGLWCDVVGGVFGTYYGCIAYVQLHLCFVTAYHLSAYFKKQEKASKLMLILGICLYLAVITELKIYFVELVIFVLVGAIINGLSLRNMIMMVGCFLALVIGMNYMTTILPDAAAMLNPEELIANLTSEKGYTNSGDLSRFTAVQTLQKMFFSDDFLKQLFGFGFGNCEASSFSIFNTPFYVKYEHLNYRWFTVAMVYLETGAAGLFAFYGSLVSCLFVGIFKGRNLKKDVLWSTGMIAIVAVVINTIYNSSFRTEAGYLTAFGLSILFILFKNEKLMSRNNEVF